MNHTAGEVAELSERQNPGDAQAPISGVASPESANAEDLIYVDSPRQVARAAASAARCVLAIRGADLSGKTVLEVENPKLAFAKAAAWLLPRPPLRPEIHPTAIVAATARLAPNIRVGPYVVIEDEVEIGTGTAVDAFCFVGRDARLGENCWLHPRVTLYAGARLGDRVEVHSGAVIGGDGFGYVFDDDRHIKFPQIGSVEIGNDVEIGCNTTIDRGSLDATQIGTGVKIDNLVQVAHNVRIGRNYGRRGSSGDFRQLHDWRPSADRWPSGHRPALHAGRRCDHRSAGGHPEQQDDTARPDGLGHSGEAVRTIQGAVWLVVAFARTGGTSAQIGGRESGRVRYVDVPLGRVRSISSGDSSVACDLDFDFSSLLLWDRPAIVRNSDNTFAHYFPAVCHSETF